MEENINKIKITPKIYGIIVENDLEILIPDGSTGKPRSISKMRIFKLRQLVKRLDINTLTTKIKHQNTYKLIYKKLLQMNHILNNGTYEELYHQINHVPSPHSLLLV